MTAPVTIAFHANCPDGWTAAWVAWHYYTDQAREVVLHPGVYGEPAPDCTGHDVVIVDFSYSPGELVALCERAESVIWLDHHASAIDAWNDWCRSHDGPMCGETYYGPVNLKIDLDLNRSGALITWDFLVHVLDEERTWWPDVPPRDEVVAGIRVVGAEMSPVELREIVERIDDRDRWIWRLDGTAEVFAALTSRPYTVEAWNEAFALGLDGLVAEGRSIARYREQLIDAAVSNAYQANIAGHQVWVANVPYAFGSDVAGRLNELHPDAPFSGYWFTDGAEQKWGLRSGSDGADVARIAAQFGGGGHTHAAGFRIPNGEGAEWLADARVGEE